MDNLIEVNDLSYAYKETEALSGISFAVSQGDICGLFGPNGSGKTTLFKCMAGILAYSGSVRIDGEEIASLPHNRISKKIAYVPQEQKPPFPFTVFEMVLMGRTPHMGSFLGPKEEDRRAAHSVLERTGIAHLSERSCTSLSGGQRQLVYIARAIAQDTPVIFLDEPTSALDFDNQILVWKIIRRVAEEGRTVIVCSHDPNHILWHASKVAVLSGSRLLTAGPPEEVMTGELLGQIYENRCRVEKIDGVSIVKPEM